MTRPERVEYDPYYERYISLVGGDDPIAPLATQADQLRDLLNGQSEERGSHAYGEGKWTIKEVLSHLIDGERIFAYRALRVSRGDETPIEGFEQDGYVENSHANERSFADLLDEFELLRRANLSQFRMLNDADWSRIGTANHARISARALAFIMAGHVAHHAKILRERYLS
jgi:uncharacterized damage-inducible protein DinB